MTPQKTSLASGFIVEAAKLAYQGDRESHMVGLVLPNLGEHLCVRSYLAPGNQTQVVVQGDDAFPAEEELRSC